MNIKTKFDLGDTVYLILSIRKKVFTVCAPCNGEGWITLEDGERYLCPKCHGQKHMITYEPEAWAYHKTLTIGQVRASVDREKHEVTYMCEETGIGSGTMWKEQDLFPTREDARIAADHRNQIDENH